MSEPLRNEPKPGHGGAHPVDPVAQIERLLLSGLDLYFAGQYQDAINIWTRVVFLERGHGRARAYIERARSAIAEQQRESDELFHRGREAYDRGALDEARELLTRAIERGGSPDEALLLLQQLNRFSRPAADQSGQSLAEVAGSGDHVRPTDEGRGWIRVVGAVALASAVALGAAPLVSWFDGAPVAGGRETLAAGPADVLPVVRTGDVVFERARALYAGGHLADALLALERIDIGDPAYARARNLRGDIQRELLATVRQPASPVRDGVQP